MNKKVVVIGLGHLGSHVIQTLALRGIANEIVGIDYNKTKEYGEIRDLADMAPYLNKQVVIRSGDYTDLADADIAVLTACGKICDEDRLQELQGSLDVVDKILPSVKENHFAGTMLVLTNPCDLVAYYISQRIDAKVIGTGAALDSARFRSRVGEALGVAPRDITGFCIGEHGDSQTLVWSQTKAGAVPVDTLLTREQMDTIEKDTVEAGCKIALSKGSTEFGIGISASEIIQAILGDEHKVLTCSVDPAGRYGQKDLYTSVPCIVSKEGAKPMPEVPLTEEENSKFQKSCEMLKGLIAAKNMKIK